MEKPAIACIAHTEDVVGEVPVWSEEDQALYWIDVFKPAIHRWDAASGAVATWAPPERLGALALTEDCRLLAALWSGLALFAPATGQFAFVARPEADRPESILNEGKCDRRGRFWVGSMGKALERASGRLHRLDGDGSCHVMDDGIWIPNGLATLFVTTARFRLPSDVLAAEPLAGAVLALEVGARGVPEPRYRGPG